MFVRARKVKDKTYYQLVRGYRDENGKVRHETLSLRSGSVEAELEYLREEKRRARRACTKLADAREGNKYAARQFMRFYRMAKEAERRIPILEDALTKGAGREQTPSVDAYQELTPEVREMIRGTALDTPAFIEITKKFRGFDQFEVVKKYIPLAERWHYRHVVSTEN